MAIDPTVGLPGGATALSSGQLLAAVLARAEDALVGVVLPTDLSSAGSLQLARLLRRTESLERRVHAVKLAIIAAAEHGDIARATGLSGTAAWVAKHTGASGAKAAAETNLAVALPLAMGGAPVPSDESTPGPESPSSDEGPASDPGVALSATSIAVRDGLISPEHARVIVRALTELPDEATAADRADVEAGLIQDARVMDPVRLRRAARHALERRDATRAVDVVEDEARRAFEQARLVMRDNLNGTWTGSFTVPTLAALALNRVLHAMTSPRRHTRPSHEPVTDWAQQRGQAFAELLERLPTDHLSGQVNTHLVVTMPLRQLLEQLDTPDGPDEREPNSGVAPRLIDTDAHHVLSPGEVRRLACSSGVIPAVLGGASLPLDLGRKARFFSEAQRVALATSYHECAAEGCDRPYPWTDLHHEDPWHTHHGRTDLAKAVPLCGFHHRLIHDSRTRSTITTHATGIKTVEFRCRI